MMPDLYQMLAKGMLKNSNEARLNLRETSMTGPLPREVFELPKMSKQENITVCTARVTECSLCLSSFVNDDVESTS